SEPEERLIRRRRLERDGTAPRSRPEPAGGLGHQGVGILLLFPAVQLRDDAVALDALDLERRAHNRRRARDRQEQGDEPLAPPRVVAGEVLVIGAGGRDVEVEPARLELAPGPLEATLEDLRAERRFLGRTNA